jgi:hypothetical protein
LWQRLRHVTYDNNINGTSKYKIKNIMAASTTRSAMSLSGGWFLLRAMTSYRRNGQRGWHQVIGVQKAITAVKVQLEQKLVNSDVLAIPI